VNFGKRVENVPEDDLELLEEEDNSIESPVGQRRWGRIQSLGSALSIHENMVLYVNRKG